MTRSQKITLARIIISSVLTLAACFIPVEGMWRLLVFAVPYLVIGYDVLWSALRNIFHGQVFDEQFLMSIATFGAFAISEYPEAAAVMIFYQTGELFQSIAVGKSRRSIAALMDICPDYAVVVRNGEEIKVSPDEVEIGETMVLRPGEKIPLDGIITEGSTTVDAAALTGESVPVFKNISDKVVSGTINLTGVIYVKTESSFGESTVSKILELVENSSEKKAKAENFITKFARYYTPCVVICAVLLALIPPLAFSGEWAKWIERALTFLM
ncbi:MAG: HAD-IC family P-type ATPase, partial [Eubacteriales bacterium]